MEIADLNRLEGERDGPGGIGEEACSLRRKVFARERPLVSSTREYPTSLGDKMWMDEP